MSDNVDFPAAPSDSASLITPVLGRVARAAHVLKYVTPIVALFSVPWNDLLRWVVEPSQPIRPLVLPAPVGLAAYLLSGAAITALLYYFTFGFVEIFARYFGAVARARAATGPAPRA